MISRRHPRVAVLLVYSLAAACAASSPSPKAEAPATLEPIPNVVTADIQAGIEAHVDARVAEGGGHFHLPFESRTLKLRLVRVHTQYLSNLGPRKHFACVDLADVGGDVFDVDFFMSDVLDPQRFDHLTLIAASICDCFAVDETKLCSANS